MFICFGMKPVPLRNVLMPGTIYLIPTYSGDNSGSKDDRVRPVPRLAVFIPGDGHTLARSL